MPHTLHPVVFDPSVHGHLVAGFNCGQESWQTALSDWITGDAVIQSMRRGTVVWLYQLAGGELVGFGSLGQTKWHKPQDIFIRAESVSLIPALAIQLQYHGQPQTVPKDEKYSSQIMTHLLTEAHRHTTRFVALRAHELNDRALNLYERFGFIRSNSFDIVNVDGINHNYVRMTYRQR